MSIERARAHLRVLGLEGRIMKFGQSSAMVELAAKAIGHEPVHLTIGALERACSPCNWVDVSKLPK